MKKRRVLLNLSLFLLFATLLLWVYGFFLHPDPDLVIIPAGSIDLGLSCFRAFHIRHDGTRWHAFSLLRREGCCLVLVLAVRHVVLPLAIWLGGEPTSPSLFEVVTQRAMAFFVWSVAGLLLLRVGLLLLHLRRWQTDEAHP